MATFTIQVDDQAILDAIDWALARDNAYPGRDPNSQIASAQDWVQLEVMNMLQALPAQKLQADTQAIIDAAMAGDTATVATLTNTIAATNKVQIASPAVKVL